MAILARPFRQKDHEDAEHWRGGWENAKTLQEVVFTTIEATVILAALDIALAKSWSWVLFLLYCAAFLALLSYLQLFLKYAINVTNEKFDLIRNRRAFAWIAGTASSAMSFGMTFLLPQMVSAFVTANFMQ